MDNLTLVSDQMFEESQAKIALIHSTIAAMYAGLVDTKLRQPINTYICLGHYLAVQGHQFTSDFESEAQGSYPIGYYNKKNQNAYVWVPSCGTEGFQPYGWAANMKNILAALYHKAPKNLVLDFRGNSGGAIYAFYTGFAPILHEFTLEDEYKGDRHTNIWKLTSSALRHYDKQTGQLLFDQPHTVTPDLKFQRISVLIDRNSASCGEILPYLLKKNANAVIYGERSAGAMSSLEEEEEEVVSGVSRFSYSNAMRFGGKVMEPLEPDIQGIPANMWVESEWPIYYHPDGSKLRKAIL